MALNITFTGNIVDNNENLIDCFYQGFHVSSGKWSNIKNSSFNQYNFNLGDSDWLGQEGAISNGQTVLIAFWKNNIDRQDFQDIFSYILVTLSLTQSVYAKDVQLLPPQPPTCVWSLVSTALIENTVTASSTTSDFYQWTYKGTTHYHKDVLYGQNIFKKVGIELKEYDFGLGFDTKTTHIFPLIGDYVITHRSTNKYGQSVECDKIIRLKYRPPVPDLYFSPPGPFKGDTVTVISTTEDIDERIISIDHNWEGELVENNLVLDYEYDKILDVFKTFTACQVVYWNDGWENKSITVCKSIVLVNQKPTIDFDWELDPEINCRYIFRPDAVDLDGEIIKNRWNLKYKLPFSDSFVDVYNSGFVSNIDFVLNFPLDGVYRVTVTTFDDQNDTNSISKDIDVTCKCAGGGGIGEEVEIPVYIDVSADNSNNGNGEEVEIPVYIEVPDSSGSSEEVEIPVYIDVFGNNGENIEVPEYIEVPGDVIINEIIRYIASHEIDVEMKESGIIFERKDGEINIETKPVMDIELYRKTIDEVITTNKKPKK